MYEILLWAVKISIALIVLKAIIGFHLPWEKCECCGRKWRDIEKLRDKIEEVK